MAAKRRGQESAAAMRRTRATPKPFSTPGTVTREEYNDISEYACTLEAENTEMKYGGRDDITTVSNLEVASAATETTTRLLTEMRALHAAQMREMTVLVAAATADNAPVPPRKEKQAQAQTQKHMNPAGNSRVRYPPSPRC